MDGPVPAPPASAGQVPTGDAATTTTPGTTQGWRKLKRTTRIALTVILILALVAGGVFATSYILDARNYVSTDNAQVAGDKIAVNAPASGTLVDWDITECYELRKNQVVGRIEIKTGFAQPLRSIRAPADGTVADVTSVAGMYVTAGTQLAVAYDLDKIYVTARVDETDIKAVRPGQQVDMTVDAFSHAQLTGRVREVHGGAAGEFALFPQANTTANFQKVTQVIPGKIAIGDRKGLTLVPGMNVTVRIHRHSDPMSR